MRLKRVRLENFKRFKKLEREFGTGVNVVKGPLNEIGKSTFLDGIVTALFENPKSTKKELEGYTTWGSERRCKTVIEFEADGKPYLLEKDFNMKTMRLAALDMGEEWNTAREVAERLAELVGTESSALFLSTSCIRQNEVSDISSGRREIGESLEGIVTGGTEETVASQVIDKLAKHINALAKGMERPTKSPGPIARLAQQVNDLRQKLAQVEEEVSEVERQKVVLVEVSHELERMEESLGEAETLLEKNKRRQDIKERIGKLEKDYDRIDTLIRGIESLQKQVRDAELSIQAIEGFDDAQKVLELGNQLRQLEAEHKNISDDLPKRRLELETARERLKRNRLLESLASRVALIIGVVVSVAGFVGMAYNFASLPAGVVGLLVVIGSMWARTRVTQQRTEIVGLQNRIVRMEEALAQAEEQEQEILSQVSCGSVEEFKQKEDRRVGLVRQKEASQNQLQGKLGMQTLKQIEQQRRDTARMLAEEREKLTDDLKSTKISAEEYVKLESKVNSLRNEQEQLQRKRMECEVGVKKARFDSEDQIQIEEMLEASTGTMNHEQKKLRVYELTRDFVSRARAETLLSATDHLQTEIQKNFEVFSNGKYRKVRVEEGFTEFWIYSDEKGDWVRPRELSGGVIDEFYLACRLALVRLIYGETCPPLVFDDPFVNFDDPRLARTLEFLNKLSKEYQIIIFTLRGAYDGVADKVIQLT